ncbi:MAG TPA: Fic family protein [Dehalococcoidia bacterium]|nr:Fic family protein [Dehalococcoidia bacterium]
MTAKTWDPIADLPPEWSSLQREDLRLIHQQWLEEKAILKDADKIRQLEERLSTEWAIETGIIERLYTVDRGITETLIDLGIEALHQFHDRGAISRNALDLIADQKVALDFVFTFVKQDRDLTAGYIKELHALLAQHQDTCEGMDQFGNKVNLALIKGAWKQLPNNPTLPDGEIHEYCPPEFVQDEIEQLLAWYSEHGQQAVDVEVEAAWLHHRFTQIHPFQDGNGRVARALATMVFLRNDYLPLVIRDTEHRERYLSALEAADSGDLASLVNLFADIQVSDLSSAIEFLRKLRGEGVSKIAASAAERVRIRQNETEEGALAVTDKLQKIAEDRFAEVKGELEREFTNSGLTLDALVGVNDDESETYWSRQIIEVARGHGYWVDLKRFRRWVRLRLRLPGVGKVQTNLVVSFHHRGTTAGLMAATAFLTTFGEDEGDSRHDYSEWEVSAASTHPFIYSSTHRDPEAGFRQWLEEAIEAGLDEWQSSI